MKKNDVPIFGIPVTRLDFAGTLDRIFELAAKRDGSPCRVLATLNVDFLTNALRVFSSAPRQPELYRVLQRAELVSADGMPIVLLSRLLGESLPERVTGADLVPGIVERAARTGTKLYFLGGKEENTRAAAALLSAAHPGVRIVGIDCPYVKLDDTPESAAVDCGVIDRINAASPDLLLVAFGNPKQELWAGRHAAALHCPVAIGIGGTFNFLCGDVKRAPRWMQKSGLEWIYRVIQEPGRLWKRYGLGFLKFNSMALGVVSTTWVARTLFRREAEFKEAGRHRLECSRSGYVGNSTRLRLVGARIAAARDGKELEFAALPFPVEIQLAAHRLLK